MYKIKFISLKNNSTLNLKMLNLIFFGEYLYMYRSDISDITKVILHTLLTNNNRSQINSKIKNSTIYTISLIQIQCYAAVFYGVLLKISPATFLQLKNQLEAAIFEPQTFQVPVYCATN